MHVDQQSIQDAHKHHCLGCMAWYHAQAISSNTVEESSEKNEKEVKKVPFQSNYNTSQTIVHETFICSL